MANTIANLVASHLEDLTATSVICVALGTTFSASNLYIGYEPDSSLNIVSLHPYGGGPPNKDSYRQNPSIQIRLKSSSRKTALDTQQEFINHFTYRGIKKDVRGMLFPIQSAPIPMPVKEEGRWVVYVTNYNVKYIKA